MVAGKVEWDFKHICEIDVLTLMILKSAFRNIILIDTSVKYLPL